MRVNFNSIPNPSRLTNSERIGKKNWQIYEHWKQFTDFHPGELSMCQWQAPLCYLQQGLHIALEPQLPSHFPSCLPKGLNETKQFQVTTEILSPAPNGAANTVNRHGTFEAMTRTHMLSKLPARSLARYSHITTIILTHPQISQPADQGGELSSRYVAKCDNGGMVFCRWLKQLLCWLPSIATTCGVTMRHQQPW